MANGAVLPVYLAFAKCDMKGMDRQKLNTLLLGDCSEIRGTRDLRRVNAQAGLFAFR